MTQDTTTAAAVRVPIDRYRPAVAFGVTLLSTAAVVSGLYARIRPELDWSNYVVGLLATIGLLGIAVAAHTGLVGRGADRSTDLVAWPGAFGAAATGLMVWVAVNDGDVVAYYAGLAVAAVSAVGIVATRRAPFVVTAVGGLFLAATQLFSDTVGFNDLESGDVHAVWAAAALAGFTVLVTAVGWPLATRATSGVTAGFLAVAGFAFLSYTLAFLGAISSSYASSYDDYVGDPPSYVVDIWVVVGLALVLIVGWAWCAAVTGNVGFRVLMVAMAVVVTPCAMFGLQVEHPTWWGVVLAGIGGLVLLAVLADNRSSTDA